MIKILIIDDEHAIRETLDMFLREKGYKVTTSEDGEKGLISVQRERPDIVILDIRLPGMNGLEVLRRIKQTEDDIHVIVITAYDDLETTKTAIALGAYEYIHKPLDADELEMAVEKAVNNLFYEMKREDGKPKTLSKRR